MVEGTALRTINSAQVSGIKLSYLPGNLLYLERDVKATSNMESANAGRDIALCNHTSSGWEFCCGALQGINKCCSHDRFTITNATNEFLDQRQ